MFNLLPSKDQYNLSSEYRLRFAAIALLLLGALGMVALVALVPSLLLSYQKKQAVEKTFESLKLDVLSDSRRKFDEALIVAGKEARALKATVSAASVYGLIEDVIRAKPESIKISGFRVARNPDGTHRVALIGQARDRNSLLSFTKVLEKDKSFTKVTVPVSNFVEAENINYSIVIDAN
jgi:hypothetical protein